MSAVARPHTRSPWRDAYELLLQRPARVTAPTFGVTEERGPGGLVVPLLRCEIPVCDEYPTSEQAFLAVLGYRRRFREQVEPDPEFVGRNPHEAAAIVKAFAEMGS